MSTPTRHEWEAYKETELEALTPLLEEGGYLLSPEQPHLSGERFLMQAVTTQSGRKLILEGTKNGKRVLIKASREEGGMRELEHERTCRQVLNSIGFAYGVFSVPEELSFAKMRGFLIAVSAYIPKDKSFIDRPVEEQVRYALRAFKAQESAHAATYEHERLARTTFGIRTYQEYQDSLKKFFADGDQELFSGVRDYLSEHEAEIVQYGGFLTHTDFVPHNFRIYEDTMYLLDHSSLRFGNKYEGWARFLNFMALYNPLVEETLVTYVENNRTPEERTALIAMRLYRLSEIISYYRSTLPRSEGDLLALNTLRVAFWTTGLRNLLKDTQRKSIFSPEERMEYQHSRDSLRSQEELRRQQNLH